MEAAIQERQRAIEERQRAIAEQQRSLRGRWGEDSNATGINGNQADTSAAFAGAATSRAGSRAL